jgi:hypothetical protein
MDDLIDLEELSFVSDFDMEGYCCRSPGTRFDEDELFIGVLDPSLLFDCCWPIECVQYYRDSRTCLVAWIEVREQKVKVV